jgi:hypothetical protein
LPAGPCGGGPCAARRAAGLTTLDPPVTSDRCEQLHSRPHPRPTSRDHRTRQRPRSGGARSGCHGQEPGHEYDDSYPITGQVVPAKSGIHERTG